MTSHKCPSEQEKRLSAKQQQAAILLAKGTTIAQTAAQVQCSEKSIDNWKKLPDFMAAIRKVEDDLYNEQLRLLKKTATSAIATLVRNMDGKTSPYVQVSAASKLLDLGLQVHRIGELEQEITELRQLLGQGDDLTA